MQRTIKQFTLLILTLTLICSCKISKYLDENTALVRRNKVVFETNLAQGNRDPLIADIQKLYRQPGISKFNAWRFYYLSKPRSDTSALVRYLLKRSKIPAVFDETEAELTAKSINNYMIQRGYFNASTDYIFENRNKWVEITYLVYPASRYIVESLEFKSQDTVIQQILENNEKESLLRPGQPVDQQLYELEVSRITNLLQNKGYANFFSNSIAPLEGDSLNGKVKVRLEVLPQRGNRPHTRYRIGELRVFSDVGSDINIEKLKIYRNNGINYYAESDYYFIRPKALDNHIFLRTGEEYSRANYDKTIRRIGRLSAIRFVTLRPEQDSISTDVLNYKLFINPSPRIGFNGNVELNNSNISIINQRFLGVSGQIGIRHKNIFSGAEQNDFRISGGVELNTRRDSARVNSNYFFRIENTLQFPKFIDAPGVFKALNAIKIGEWRLLNSRFYENLQENANTRFTINADFVTQRLFYSYNSFNFTYGYDLLQDNRKKYVINQTGVNYFTPSFTDQFIERILNNNEFLRRSLVKQFFTGFVFRDLSFSYTSAPNKARETYSVFSNVEISGAEFALAGLILQKPITQIGDVELAKYAKLDIDGRYTRVYNDKHSAAGRINVGIASPYESSAEVPFVKQFFVGGGLSIRAWQLRQLGPGSYRDTSQQTSSLDLFQTGDFKFEINGEYRYRLYGLLETALFVDCGNVWILREDPQRPGARLTARNFVRDLAIGSGVGFRLVFDFFIIRLDWGIKVKTPYQTEGSYWARGNFRELTNLNLAISYPF